MILIIDCGTDWLKEIKNNLTELGYSSKVFGLNKLEDCKFKSFSGIIISGASTLLTQVNSEEYLRLFKFVKTVKTPILGICLGHQIIGLLYESEIRKGELVDRKEYIEIVKDDTLFTNIKNKSLFREEHSEYITLPKGFSLLAKSKSCDNEVMKHKSKSIYGVQFHPEVSKDNGKKIFKNFLEMC